MSWLIGSAATPYGRHEGSTTLSLMSEAASAAAGRCRPRAPRRRRADLRLLDDPAAPDAVDASSREHFGLKPAYAHAIQLGGATGFAMVMLAHQLVEAGRAATSWSSPARTG